MIRTASVVVNTVDRAESLRRTLLALSQLAYPELEIIVVAGPSSDHTTDVLAEFDGRVKVGFCEERNLSMSRNIGAKLASGDLIAFIDDDAIPEPWWLDDIAPAFHDPEVAASGGPVYDFDGRTLYSLFCMTDSHGDITLWGTGPNPSRALAAPFSDLFVCTIGTNAVFRRCALIGVGGFDETFGYYLEESEICRRLIDRGWVVEAQERGIVYHLREESSLRGANRFQRSFYPLLRSRLYFGLRHARPRVGLVETMRRYADTVQHLHWHCQWGAENGFLRPEDVEAFEHDAVRAADEAFDSAARPPAIRHAEWFESDTAFLQVPRPAPLRRLHVCIVTREYLPKQLNGIARLSHELGVALARRGHVVRIITEADAGETVEFENEVWVHRIAARPAESPPHLDAPPDIWGFADSAMHEVRRISDLLHPVDVVQAPNWNSEGLAIMEDGSFVSILGLHTPLATVARIDSQIDPSDRFVQQLLGLERRCYERASAFLACGQASAEQVEQEYDLELPRDRIGLVPFGIRDHRFVADGSDSRHVNVLFVGRLEARKGIDTLLDAIAMLLPTLPDVAFTIVGNDTLPGPSGRTYREEFERKVDSDLRDRSVVFRGVASEADLAKCYAACDIFVAPSRSESFGLILLEAMREGKPVVAGDVGGMREIVEHEGNGLLVPPGQPDALAEALERLAESSSLRERFGRRSRDLFVERFTADRMARDYERFCFDLLERHEAADLVPIGASANG